MGKALRYADRVYVLRHGRVTMSGTAEELSGRLQEIENSYLCGVGPRGRPAAGSAQRGAGVDGEHLTGDPARLRTGEEEHGMRGVPGRALGAQQVPAALARRAAAASSGLA